VDEGGDAAFIGFLELTGGGGMEIAEGGKRQQAWPHIKRPCSAVACGTHVISLTFVFRRW
jgi:hypothetical protein